MRRGQQVLQVRQVPQVSRVRQVLRDRPGRPARKVLLVRKARRVLRDRLEQRVRWAQLDPSGLPVLLEQRARLDRRAHQGWLVLRGLPGPRV